MGLAPVARLGPIRGPGAIGAGGMGEVYKVRDTRPDRSVAIWVPARRSAPRRSGAPRFERRAKAIAGLDHPHICALHSVGEPCVLHLPVR